MNSVCGCVSFKETPLALTLFWDFKRSQVCFMPGSCFAVPQRHSWAGSRTECVFPSASGEVPPPPSHLAQVMLVLLFVGLYEWNKPVTVSSWKLPLKKQKQNGVFNLDILPDYFISWLHEHLNWHHWKDRKMSEWKTLTWPGHWKNWHV